MSPTKRIDPRRPYHLGPTGLRRIVLGDAGAAPAGDVASAQTKIQAKPLRTTVAPQRWIMAVAHSERGRLEPHAREALAAAAILAGPETGVVAVVLGELGEGLAEAGADQVVVLAGLGGARYLPEAKLEALLALVSHFDPMHVLMADAANGDGDLGRRLAAALGATAAAHVKEIGPGHAGVVWRPSAALAIGPLPRIVLIEPGTVDTRLPFEGSAELVPVGPFSISQAALERCRDLGLEDADRSGVPLEEADFVVAAGSGVKNVDTLERLAASLGAAVGASRVAVDEGKLPRDRQVGATGKSVSASVYMAIGISGAVQHLDGIKSCRHVIAVNRDRSAPIAQRADLTVVADAEDLMQALLKRVGEARAQHEPPGGSS